MHSVGQTVPVTCEKTLLSLITVKLGGKKSYYSEISTGDQSKQIKLLESGKLVLRSKF